MKVLLLCGVMFLSACSGMAVNHFSDADLPGTTFKTVEVYKQNAFGPSFNYVMLFTCDADSENCVEALRTPNITPGYVTGLIAPVIQAGAIVGGAVIVGNGLSNIKVSPNINPVIKLR